MRSRGLSRQQLDTPYRAGGWTVRQLVHHIADSHTNAFVRLRLALTEDWPTIKPYDEKAWAELRDSKAATAWSLGLVEDLHARWVMLLESLSEEQWERGMNRGKTLERRPRAARPRPVPGRRRPGRGPGRRARLPGRGVRRCAQGGRRRTRSCSTSRATSGRTRWRSGPAGCPTRATGSSR